MVLIRAALIVAVVLPVGCANVIETKDISYDDRFGDFTTLDVYAPSGALAAPAIVMIHGGSWRTGFKEQFDDAAERFAGAGYAAITINYRIGGAGAFPNAVKDCACALSYVRGHASELAIDSQRVAVMGYSSGGHLAALLGVAVDDPELAPDCASGPTSPPAAVISGSGMQDLHDFSDYETVRDFLGGTTSEVPAAYSRASPMLQVGAGEPPFLLIHGTDDVFDGVDQSLRMRRALTAQANVAGLLLLEGGGHLFNPSDDGAEVLIELATETPEAWLAMLEFLERTLGPP